MKELYKQVLERDGYACRRCGAYTEARPHHVKPKGRYPSLKRELSNMIVLCYKCHRWVHDHPKQAHYEGFLYVRKYGEEDFGKI